MTPAPIFNVGMTLAELEKQAILFTVQYFQGNHTAAAKSLGLSDKTVREKTDRYKKEETDARDRAAKQRDDAKLELARQRGNVGHNSFQHNGDAKPKPGQNQDARMEEVARLSAKNGTNGVPNKTANGVESAQRTPTQQPVSVPKQQEIQGVLPKQASGNRNR